MTVTTRVSRSDADVPLKTTVFSPPNTRPQYTRGPTRVCLVGAGVIAAVHAEVLSRLPSVRLVALVEPDTARAHTFAKRWKIDAVHSDLDAALLAGGFDCVHILTPPNTHAALAQVCIDASVHVLVEKPLATCVKDVEALTAAAQVNGVVAGVNQNFVFHPAFARLRRAILDGEVGPLRDVHLAYNVPLRQLAARQFGHWMFDEPANILLEQAVHPLSQILALIGPIAQVRACGHPGTTVAKDVVFHDSAEAILVGARHTAHLQFAVGRAFPFWQVTAICDDGVLIADILNNRFYRLGRGPGLEPLDALAQSLKTAAQIAGCGIANAVDYAASLLRLKPRSDAFYRSMAAGITAYHRALRNEALPDGDQPTDFAFGGDLVAVCAELARQGFGARPRSTRVPSRAAQLPPADITLFGGTGFIGAATTARLATAGYKVRVVARNVRNLAEVFHHPSVHVMRGDIKRADDVASAVAGVPVVINLAHGGGGETYADISRAMVGGARTIAEACLSAGVTQLIHVGSIASLYLGDAADVVTGTTPPDTLAEKRADYARAKAAADCMLLALHRDRGLPVTILRPGLVVGEGCSPFHSGLGMFNNDQHCIGWNSGRNALPFVLVDDVAAAIVATVGRRTVAGKCYNLVGSVRPDARAYIASLAGVTRRPLRFYASRVAGNYVTDLGKWALKRLGGRAGAPPSLRDLRSRGLVARFDCSDAMRDLDWHPEADCARFFARAFARV